jgi:hypothetical protein
MRLFKKIVGVIVAVLGFLTAYVEYKDTEGQRPGDRPCIATKCDYKT